MNTLTTQTRVPLCTLLETDKPLIDWMPGTGSFNAPAIRIRAGIVNLMVGTTMLFHCAAPESALALYSSAFLLFDMLSSVFFGLTPLCLSGVIATLLSGKLPATPVPHLPQALCLVDGFAVGSAIDAAVPEPGR